MPVFWLLIFWAIVWICKNAAEDVMGAVKGRPSPRRVRQLKRIEASGGTPGYGVGGFARDFADDFLRARTEKRRELAQRRKREAAGPAEAAESSVKPVAAFTPQARRGPGSPKHAAPDPDDEARRVDPLSLDGRGDSPPAEADAAEPSLVIDEEVSPRTAAHQEGRPCGVADCWCAARPSTEPAEAPTEEDQMTDGTTRQTLHRGDDEFGAVNDRVGCVRCEDHGRYPCPCRSTTSHNQPVGYCSACGGDGLIDCNHQEDRQTNPVAPVIPIFRTPNTTPNQQEVPPMTEVTGLTTAVAYAQGVAAAHQSHAGDAETFAAALASNEVGDGTLGLVARAQEASNSAAAAWDAVADDLETQNTAVKEAYESSPDAGNKEFATSE